MGSGMSVVVDNEFCGQWGPVVVVKNSVAKELDKPRPVGIFVIVTGYVESEPGAAIFHIGLKGCTLLVCVGKVVEPEYDLVVAETGVAVFPVGSGIQGKAITGSKGGIEVDGITGKIDMIGFHGGGEEGKSSEGMSGGYSVFSSA